jgi:hypothetical protein
MGQFIVTADSKSCDGNNPPGQVHYTAFRPLSGSLEEQRPCSLVSVLETIRGPVYWYDAAPEGRELDLDAKHGMTESCQ